MENFSKIDLVFPPSYTRMAEKFFEKYICKSFTCCPEKPLKNLTPRKLRVCRFCGLSHPLVKFRNDAHVFPQHLGNQHLISDFECDNCNQFFSKYENDLANFLGPIRVLQGIKGKKAKGKFETPDKKINVNNEQIFGITDSITISRSDVLDYTFINDKENGVSSVRFIKHNYTPIKVYKSILKIALTCVNHNDAKFYNLAKKLLLTDELDNKVNGITKVFSYSMPLVLGHREPIAFLYEKIDKSLELPSQIFVMYFANYIFQIAIPLNDKDLNFYDGREIEYFICPPLFNNFSLANDILIQENIFDWSSHEAVKNEEFVLNYKLNIDDIENIEIYNPITGEITKDVTTFGLVKKMILIKQGTIVNFPILK